MVLNNSNNEGKRFTFTTKQQSIRCQPSDDLTPRRVYETNKYVVGVIAMCTAARYLSHAHTTHRKYSIDTYEGMAEEFARKRLGTSGVLPVRMIEVW